MFVSYVQKVKITVVAKETLKVSFVENRTISTNPHSVFLKGEKYTSGTVTQSS